MDTITNGSPTVDWEKSYKSLQNEYQGLKKASDEIYRWLMWRHGGATPEMDQDEAIKRFCFVRYGK